MSKLVAALFLSFALAGTPAIASIVTPLASEADLQRELTRRGLGGSMLAAGTWSTASTLAFGRTESELRDAASLWSAPLRFADDELGILLVPEFTLIGRGSDPHRQFLPAHLPVREGPEVDPAWRLRSTGILEARLHHLITAHVRFTLESEGKNEVLDRTRDFSQLGASNNFDEAWIRAQSDHLSLTLGRAHLGWGPERNGSLLLSTAAPAFDMIHLGMAWGSHSLQSFAGQISTEEVDGGHARRFVYGHRADLRFAEGRLRVGFSEMALAAGQHESLNLRYVNPIPLWAQVQVERDGDPQSQVNLIDMVDAEFFLPLQDSSARFYASLAVDDIQVSSVGRDRDPDQLAWTVGSDLSRGAWLAGYEYRRIGSWTYLHRGDATEYRHYYRPIGAPEGPDTDSHDLRLDYRRGPRWLFWLSGSRWRQGTNTLATNEVREGNVGRPFPLPRAEKRWVGQFGVLWSMPGRAKAALQAAFYDIEDLNHVAGESEQVWELRLTLTLRGPVLRTLIEAP